jgi:serine/threonine protein kinase
MDLERLFLKEKRADLSLFQRVKMLRDAALGMRWLHESDPIFIHRDLKLSNLLVGVMRSTFA